MTLLTWSAEGGSNGTTISAANSGGASGNAFDVVPALGSGAVFAYDSTLAAHGTLSAKCSTSATSSGASGQWTTSMGALTTFWWRIYFQFSANPAANIRIAQFGTGSAGIFLRLNTTGHLEVVNLNGSATITTSTAAVPLNAWFRLEGTVTMSASAGQTELKMFTTSADAVSADETDTSAATLNLGGTTVSTYAFGLSAGASNVVAFWMDDLGLSSVAYIGPATAASIPWTAPRSAPPPPSQFAPWGQRDRRNALLVGTAANPLVPPLDTAWQSGARYWHLYADTAIRESRAYFTQRGYISNPALLGTAELENELLGGADTARHGTVLTDRRQVPQQRAYASDPLLLTTAELENELLGAADTGRHGSAAAYTDRRLAPQQPRRDARAPGLLDTAELENELLGGADTAKRYAVPATHGDRREVPQQRLYVSDPSLTGTALLENELLGGGDLARACLAACYQDRRLAGQQRWYVSDPLLLAPPAAADPLLAGWLPGWLNASRAASHADRRLAPQQRLYISDPSFYPTTAPADPLTLAWGDAGPYWHLYNTASSHADRRLVPQQRSYVSDPGLLLTALLENELLGSGDTARHWLPACYGDRREVPQQRPYVSDPSVLVTALLENELLGAGDTARHYLAAAYTDRRLVPAQRPYVSDPSLLSTALLENELLGGAGTPPRYSQPATHYLRSWMPQQPARLADPLLIGTALLENELLGGAGTWQHLAAAMFTDRREVPAQRAYVSDPSFYPSGAATDPLTVAWGAGGSYWHLYNRAAGVTDRRQVPAQRAYISDPRLLLTALLENELLGGGDTWRHTTAAWYDRREVPQQRPYGTDPLLLAQALLENELLGNAGTWQRYNQPATHADRRLVPAQPRRAFDMPGVPADPVMLLADSWRRWNTAAYRPRTWPLPVRPVWPVPPPSSMGILTAAAASTTLTAAARSATLTAAQAAAGGTPSSAARAAMTAAASRTGGPG